MRGPGKFDPEQGPFAPGEQFQKFEIRRLIGRGGHAYVYHGYDGFLDRHIALKVIPDPIERGRDLQRRAQLEARVLCKLQHPNLVHVYDAGTIDDEIVYLVMELLEGRTLRDVFREYRSLSVAEILRIGAQIADGVQTAHESNAIHRDLKPENVFVQPGNAIKVLDFGIAKLLGASNQTTQKDLLHGTMLYMSPEHLQGFGVTPRSDIYALGTILYEAVAGGPPCLLGVAEPTIRELAWIQISRIPTPLDELVPGVPHYVARGIQRMLAKDPADRFASMAEVGALLRSYLARLEAESPGALTFGRELWHPASEEGQSSDTVAQTKPPFTVPPPSRDRTSVISGSAPSPPLTHTLPLDAAALQRELSGPQALPQNYPAAAAPPGGPLHGAPLHGRISPELVPTRTAALALSNEPTPMAADSLRPSTPPRVKIWTVVAAGVTVGTVAGLGVAFGLGGRAREEASAAPISNSAELEPAPPSATVASTASSSPAETPAPAPAPVVESAQAPVDAPAPSESAVTSAPVVAAPVKAPASRPKNDAGRAQEGRAGGAFSAALRASASAKPGEPKSSAPSVSRLPLPSELPGSGLDDPPPPPKKKARSSP
jgi:serine/threonine protein kinase